MKINLKISSCLNWAITILWICFILWLWFFSGKDQPNELNAIGDYMAGAFAPLAFFWLVRGFYLQSKGLEQNSEALKLQAKELKSSTDALNLQAQELKNSVDEQKKIFEIQKREITAKHFAARPHLQFQFFQLQIQEEVIDEYCDDEGNILGQDTADFGIFNLKVENLGEVAKHFSIIDNDTSYPIYSKVEINKNSAELIQLSLDPQELSHLKETNEFVKKFSIIYFDTYRKKFQQTITIVIHQDFLNKDHFHLQHQISNTITNDD